MISATTRTPVEIWTKILKHPIHVSIFFDADPIESHGVAAMQQYHWELPYWSSERHRNSFRRVCSSWNQYLSRFNHRYIRMTDIVHGVVPKTAFPHAIRLNIELCGCETCTVLETSDVIYMEDQAQFRAERLGDLLDTHGQHTQLKIIHGGTYDNAMKNPRVLGSIKLQSVASNDIGFLPWTDTSTLRTLIGIQDGTWQLIKNHHPPLYFPSLTTLSVEVHSFAEFTGQHFDTLKHLSIARVAETPGESESLMEILKVLGPKLETFYWRSELSNKSMPEEIWSVCPRLCRIQTPYKWGQNPPLNHPIRCLRVTFEGILYWDLPDSPSRRDFRQHLPVSVDGRFGRRGVMLAYHWSRLLFSLQRYTSISVLWEAMDVAADSGLDFVDLNDMYLEEYILTFLVHVWRREIVRRTYCDNDIYEPLEF